MKQKSVIIIGYYDHNNLGDEQYKNSFNYYIKNILKYNCDNCDNIQITYIDCDKLPEYKEFISDDDIIIVGGGDVLNDYFLDTIIKFFNHRKNTLHAISVGIPYLNIISSNKLHIFNTIFIRTRQDVDLLKRVYKNINIEYIPDISFYLIKDFKKTDLKLIKNIPNKKIAIALSRSIYNKNYRNEYALIIKQFAIFVKFLISSNYHVIFVPFNLNKYNSNENDTIIHNDIYNTILDMNILNKEIINNNITNIQYQLTENDIMNIFLECEIVIPMRYHACLFSLYTKTPFLPIYSTRKIQNLLKDISWTYGYRLTLNEYDVPIDINLNVLIYRFKNLIDDYTNACDHIQQILNDFETYNQTYLSLNTTNSKSIILINQNTTINKIIDIKNHIDSFLLQNYNFSINHLYKIQDDDLQNIIIQMVSYYLTNGNMNSEYNYGLKEKMFKEYYDIDREWAWIIENEKLQPKITLSDNPHGLFNITYIDQQDHSNVHRSGWSFVYDNIKLYHNSQSKLLLDLYIDKTFHWNFEINKILGIVPYTKPWCGFIHHTMDTEFSEYNCKNLLKNQTFIDSLLYCKGLFVLSKYLQTQLKTELHKLNINVPVFEFVHPTELNVPLFTLDKFINNNNKKLLHVGGWLRNIYNFYKLQIPNTIKINNIYHDKPFSKFKWDIFKYRTCQIQKVALKGKSMNNYYPHDNLLNNIYSVLTNKTHDEPKLTIIPNCSTNVSNQLAPTFKIVNNWNKHFYSDLENNLNSIKIIEYIDNTTYDELLSSNIVFLNLVDASAINTLIECIARNTPIIINKIPAVVELLGKNYPLYYDNLNDIHKLVNINKINKAYKYMQKLDKTKLKISYFICEFINTLHKI